MKLKDRLTRLWRIKLAVSVAYAILAYLVYFLFTNDISFALLMKYPMILIFLTITFFAMLFLIWSQ